MRFVQLTRRNTLAGEGMQCLFVQPPIFVLPATITAGRPFLNTYWRPGENQLRGITWESFRERTPFLYRSLSRGCLFARSKARTAIEIAL